MKIAVLVSGGVDSSVALHMLKAQGNDVTAFYLKIWLEDELSFLGECPWEKDLSYVRAVCKQLNVPLEIISLQKEYWDTVVSYTVDQVKKGRTPNPDVLCNQYVKFGFFLDRIDGTYDKVASGHYAQLVDYDNELVSLQCSPDQIKDQTYFLSQMSQKQLQRVLFPIGHLTKQEIREYAQQVDLPTKDRKDSQGICFLGKLKFREFVAYYVGIKKGDLVEYETNKIVGRHDGYWFYTIGQRQGIGLSGGPWYVVDKAIDINTVFISSNYYSSEKKRDNFFVTNLNWIIKVPENSNVQVKLRHGQHRSDCMIAKVFDDRYKILLSEQDQGIADGQFAVFYDDNVCLGSGTIETK